MGRGQSLDSWGFLSRDDPVKHAAKRDAIDITGMNTETDETTGDLIHHHQHPMAFKANRLTSEQIDTPKAVFHVANESEPGMATATGFWSIVFDEDASDDMFVDLDAKRLGYAQCDPRTAEVRIAALEFNDGTNKCIGRTFRSGFCSLLRREEPAVLALHQALVEVQQG